MLPLSAVRVLDLTDGSESFCGTLLSDLGAEVLCGVDLDDAADAVIIAGTPSALARRGLDPAALLERFPRLIVASLSPFGLRGPRAEWRSCDTVAQALGGMLFVNGHPDEPPLPALGAQAYHCAGLQAAIGIVLALLARRQQRPRPDRRRQRAGEHGRRARARHRLLSRARRRCRAAGHAALDAARSASPMCRDGPVLLSHMGDWTALIEWLKSDGAAHDLTDPRWADSELRRAECAHVFDVLDAWAARYRVDRVGRAGAAAPPAVRPGVAAGARRAAPAAVGARLLRSRDERRVDRRRWRAPFRCMERGGAHRFGGGRLEEVPPQLTRPAHPLAAAAAAPARSRFPSNGRRCWTASACSTSRGWSPDRWRRACSPITAPTSSRSSASTRRTARSGAAGCSAISTAASAAWPSTSSDARGLALVRELARRCDVVIDNFSPRVMANWGLDAGGAAGASRRA